MENVDLVIRNGKVFNSYLKCFRRADVYVLDGRIYYIDVKENGKTEITAEKELDASGYYIIPGLIDIHMHIESSMMTPRTFAGFAGKCGVTTVVSEPHEMANIKGLNGIYEMMADGGHAPIDIFYGIPSSVPSTNENLETTGEIIDCQAMKELLERKEVICVGEIMNYRQIIRENDLEITKFLKYLREKDPNFVIEGHCPSLTGLDLAKFLYLGIDGDHTEHTLEEIQQRFENGMFVELQEKMLRPEILDYIRENRLYEHCGFVTDDTMADKLYEEGQLNKVLEEAIRMGFPTEEAIYCGTYTNARRMNLRDRGVLAPGKTADFALVTGFDSLEPDYVYKDGKLIASKEQAGGKLARAFQPEESQPGESQPGESQPEESQPEENQPGENQQPGDRHIFPEDYYHSVCIPVLKPEDFQVCVKLKSGSVQVRVIEVSNGRTQTSEKIVSMPVRDYKICWEGTGCLLAMVLERYGKNRNIGYGFVTGDCLKEGAAASTYFHDHHNLFVIGENVRDMQVAVERIQELQGGILTAFQGKISAELPLPVAGILSDRPVDEIGPALKKVRNSLFQLGYRHYNPVMSLCTLGLPVSPALKLTDRGLVDVIKGEIVELVIS